MTMPVPDCRLKDYRDLLQKMGLTPEQAQENINGIVSR